MVIDFDKMTVAEHEQYREMQRKAEAFDIYHEGVKKMIEQDMPVTLAMAKVHDDFEGTD